MEKLPSPTRTFTWNNNEIAYISVSESTIRIVAAERLKAGKPKLSRLVLYPVPDLNRCYRRERATS